MFKFHEILAASVIAGATLVAGGALAEQDITADGPVQVVVHYGDLNLNTTEGANTLRARLNAAVASVEGPVDVRDLKAEAVCQRDHRKAMAMADVMIADSRMRLAYAGPRHLHLG